MKKFLNDFKGILTTLMHPFDDAQAHATFAALIALLRSRTSVYDVTEALHIMLHTLRTEALQTAQLDYASRPEKYPGYISALFDEWHTLQLKSPAFDPYPENMNIRKEFPFELGTLSGCQTPISVKAFFEDAYEFMDKNPTLCNDGYRILFDVLRQEIIAAYFSVVRTYGSRSRYDGYILSLLSATECAVIDNYPMSIICYADGYFEAVTPEKIANENDLPRLKMKIEVMRNAIKDFSHEAWTGYVTKLSEQIPSEVFVTLWALPGREEPMPEVVAFYMACLSEIEDGSFLDIYVREKTPTGIDSLSGYMAAQSTLHALCAHHEIDYLKNDWVEFLHSLAACPACAEYLGEYASAVLGAQLIVNSMELAGKPLPDAILCRVRLLLALTTSSTRIIYDDDVFAWVLDNSGASHKALKH